MMMMTYMTKCMYVTRNHHFLNLHQSEVCLFVLSSQVELSARGVKRDVEKKTNIPT